MRILNLFRSNTKSKYPICPQCGKNTIVLFTPPKEGIVGTPEGYRTMGTPDYVDWDKAHLYCANGQTNCDFNTPIKNLTTPVKEDYDAEAHAAMYPGY